jgi:hypothetical protein
MPVVDGRAGTLTHPGTAYGHRTGLAMVTGARGRAHETEPDAQQLAGGVGGRGACLTCGRDGQLQVAQVGPVEQVRYGQLAAWPEFE